MASVELATAYVNIVSSTKGLGRDIQKQFGQVEAGAQRTGTRVGERFRSGLMKVAKVTGAGVAATVGTALVKGWGRLTAIENAQAKLRGLGHDAASVDKIMQNALASVQGTAFNLDEAATTAAGAVAAGIKPGQELEGVLKSVANSAAAAGIGMDEMGGIYNKVASIGKAQNDVLYQVADRGIPIYEALASQLGVTTDEVFKMASAGQIGFSEFEQAMTTATGTVADELGQTTTGNLSRIGAALARFGQSILSGVFPHIAPAFAGIAATIDDLALKVGPLAEEFGGRLASALRFVVSTFSTWGPILGTVVAGLAAYYTTQKLVIAGTILWNTYTTIARIATAGWAVQVRLLNAAMRANPIGAVITAITLLVAGFILAYKRVGWFRDMVNGAWAGIKTAVSAVVGWFQAHVWPVLQAVWSGIATGATWLWQNVIAPAWAGIKIAAAVVVAWFQTYVAPVLSATLNVLGAVFTWLWQNIIVPVWNGIKIAIGVAWTIIKGYFTAIKWVIDNVLIPVFLWLYRNVIKPVWAGIQVAIQIAWAAIQIIFKSIEIFIKAVLAPVFNWLWRNIIVPVWNGIRTAIAVVWAFLQTHVFSPMKWLFENVLAPMFRWFKSTVIDPVWNGIKTTISAVWNFIRDKVFAPLQKAIRENVPKAFEKGKDAIGKAWEKVQDVAKKPVKFVIETVINNGIIEGFNTIASKFGVDGIDPIKPPKGFATGGYTGPGRKYKPAGIVHADEYVIRKESQKKLSRRYGRGVLDHMNRFGTIPGYARGGKVGKGTLWDAAQWWIQKGARASRHSWFNGGRRITSGHSRNSLHYQDRAVDFNYGPPGTSAIEQAFFDRHIRAFQSLFPGIRTIWRAPGHYDHLHIDTSRGANIGNGTVGGGGGGGLLSGFLRPFEALKEKIAEGVGDSAFGKLIGAGARKMVEAPIEWIKSNIDRVAGWFGDGWDSMKEVAGKGTAKAQGMAWAAANGVPWGDLNYIVTRESGWNPKARNPRSSAAGLPQFIAANQRHYGVYPITEKSVSDQLQAMHRYVMDRYGSWPNARRYWERNRHYSVGGLVKPTLYDKGGILPPGAAQLVSNKTRRPEYILPAKLTDALLSQGSLIGAPRGDTWNLYGPDPVEVAREVDRKRRRRELLEVV